MKTVSPTLLSSHTSVIALFTTRMGGVSQIPYSSANLAFHVGDDLNDVITNHETLANTLGYDRKRLIHMRQIHSDTIIVVDDGLSFETPPECDALITNRLSTPLMVMSADCTPILLYDPIHHAIGAVHAGRAGALKEILPKTIMTMEKEFGSVASTINVILGPSIHGCCYEINSAIAKETHDKGYFDALRVENEKIFLDVNTILTMQLARLGVEKIEVIDECTACHNDRYFSYRADAQQTGRIAGIIILR
jgi:polyphenol oxidase